VEGCDCYNYCGSEFAGCCALNGASCSVSCSSLSVGEVLTAGCQLPDPPTSLTSAPSPPPAPISAPVEQAGTCLIEKNTELCAGLTANQSPVDGCGCYNYCGSEFMGCCPFDGGCSVSCSALSPGEVLTAGCQLPEGAQPATTPPAEPTSAPIEGGPSCLAKKNTEHCTGLTENQEPVQGCGCYNYCGSEFAGCCPFDSGCSVSCASLSAGEVLIAGCEL
jgi:hypothetical protein